MGAQLPETALYSISSSFVVASLENLIPQHEIILSRIALRQNTQIVQNSASTRWPQLYSPALIELGSQRQTTTITSPMYVQSRLLCIVEANMSIWKEICVCEQCTWHRELTCWFPKVNCLSNCLGTQSRVSQGSSCAAIFSIKQAIVDRLNILDRDGLRQRVEPRTIRLGPR